MNIFTILQFAMYRLYFDLGLYDLLAKVGLFFELASFC